MNRPTHREPHSRHLWCKSVNGVDGDEPPRAAREARTVLGREDRRGEVPEGLAEFPQIIAAPGLVAIIWSGLFERFEPLDVRKMMKTHVELLFAPRRA